MNFSFKLPPIHFSCLKFLLERILDHAKRQKVKGVVTRKVKTVTRKFWINTHIYNNYFSTTAIKNMNMPSSILQSPLLNKENSCKWYQNPTDTGSILNFRSCAQLQYKRNILEGSIHRSTSFFELQATGITLTKP